MECHCVMKCYAQQLYNGFGKNSCVSDKGSMGLFVQHDFKCFFFIKKIGSIFLLLFILYLFVKPIREILPNKSVGPTLFNVSIIFRRQKK